MYIYIYIYVYIYCDFPIWVFHLQVPSIGQTFHVRRHWLRAAEAGGSWHIRALKAIRATGVAWRFPKGVDTFSRLWNGHLFCAWEQIAVRISRFGKVGVFLTWVGIQFSEVFSF